MRRFWRNAKTPLALWLTLATLILLVGCGARTGEGGRSDTPSGVGELSGALEAGGGDSEDSTASGGDFGGAGESSGVREDFSSAFHSGTASGENEQNDSSAQEENGGENSQGSPENSTMRISVTDGVHTVVFACNNSRAAASLLAQLPLTTKVEDYLDNEKIFYPEPLDITGAIDAPGGGRGTLAYFSPWGNVVMYYGDYGRYKGLFVLGEALSGAEQIERLSGEITVTAIGE